MAASASLPCGWMRHWRVAPGTPIGNGCSLVLEEFRGLIEHRRDVGAMATQTLRVQTTAPPLKPPFNQNGTGLTNVLETCQRRGE